MTRRWQTFQTLSRSGVGVAPVTTGRAIGRRLLRWRRGPSREGPNSILPRRTEPARYGSFLQHGFGCLRGVETPHLRSCRVVQLRVVTPGHRTLRQDYIPGVEGRVCDVIGVLTGRCRRCQSGEVASISFAVSQRVRRLDRGGRRSSNRADISHFASEALLMRGAPLRATCLAAAQPSSAAVSRGSLRRSGWGPEQRHRGPGHQQTPLPTSRQQQTRGVLQAPRDRLFSFRTSIPGCPAQSPTERPGRASWPGPAAPQLLAGTRSRGERIDFAVQTAPVHVPLRQTDARTDATTRSSRAQGSGRPGAGPPGRGGPPTGSSAPSPVSSSGALVRQATHRHVHDVGRGVTPRPVTQSQLI